jgi:hypothetical protein
MPSSRAKGYWKTSEHKMFTKIIHINIVILKSVAEKYLLIYSPSEVKKKI